MSEGIFITFEGGEGSGKSTQMKAFSMLLADFGYQVLCVREPGGTVIGEKIRDILLDPGNGDMCDSAELLLYEAARAQLMHEVIEPAITQGKIVLCDRFTDSTLAYQGYGRGLSIDVIERLNDYATGGRKPDRTIYLALAPEIGLERATRKTSDRLELLGDTFHERVHEGFEKMADGDDRIRIVHTQAKRSQTALAILDELLDLFPGLSRMQVVEAIDANFGIYFKGHED